MVSLTLTALRAAVLARRVSHIVAVHSLVAIPSVSTSTGDRLESTSRVRLVSSDAVSAKVSAEAGRSVRAGPMSAAAKVKASGSMGTASEVSSEASAV